MNFKRQIPNILTVLRFLMVPVFVIFYFKYPEFPKTFIALGVYVVAWLTDVLDGYLARKNGWVTDIGKIIDPLADKIMQIAMAVCFTIDNRIFLILLIPLVLKELAMLVGAVLIIRNNKVVVQANWYGKLATVLIFICAFFRLIIRGNATLDIVMAVLMLASMLFSLIMYYLKDFKGKYKLSIFGK